MIEGCWSRVALLCIAMTIAGCEANSPRDQSNSTHSIDRQSVLDLMSEYGIPGMAIAISYKGKDQFYNFGVLDIKTEEAVTQNTIFEIGSVSKLFTATLATLADQKNLISLNTPIGKYIDQITDTPLGAVPVLHLATHTAGGFPLQLPEHINSQASLFEYYREWEPEYPPGTQRHYANPSVGLLGILVARAHATDYATAMDQSIFSVIGMESTHFVVPEKALGRYAWGHSRDGERTRVSRSLLADEAYGMKTTSSDLLKFLKLNLNHEDGPDSLKRAIQQTHTGHYATEFFQQALIWENYEYPINLNTLRSGHAYRMSLESSPVTEVKVVAVDNRTIALSKTGSTGGFGAYVLVVPHEDFAILLLANKNYPNDARIETACKLSSDILSIESE